MFLTSAVSLHATHSHCTSCRLAHNHQNHSIFMIIKYIIRLRFVMGWVTIEYARSDRTHCRECLENLKLKEIRIGWDHTGAPIEWYHPKCFVFAQKPLNDTQGHGITGYEVEELRGWKKLKNSEVNRIRGILGKYKTRMAKMILPKSILQMSVSELKDELKRRRVKCSGRKSELQHRLRDYMEYPWIKAKHKQRRNLVADGYCRRFEKQSKTQIPLVLVELIKSYAPCPLRGCFC